MLLYRALITLAAPVLALVLLVRAVRGRETWGDLGERLGLAGPRPAGPFIWLHGASNGELTAARPLIAALAAHLPETCLLVTCNSISAKAMVTGWDLPNTSVRLCPLDLRWMHRRMLAKGDIRLFVLFEGDFWPNRIHVAAQEGPAALIGGRVSSGSARTWGRFTGLARRMFRAFTLIAAQDGASEQRLLKLGADAGALLPQITLKALAARSTQPLPHSARRDVWLAASTHEGEDEILLHAHLIAREAAPELRLILAPRHARGAAIAVIAHSLDLSTLLRSEGHPGDAPCDVYIADTLGEMDHWYAQARSCFVAGSLVPKGGHTPFEPAAFDCALIHGPYLENFVEPYAALHRAGGAQLCRTADDIAKAVIALRDKKTADAQCAAAQDALSHGQGLDDLAEKLAQCAKGR